MRAILSSLNVLGAPRFRSGTAQQSPCGSLTQRRNVTRLSWHSAQEIEPPVVAAHQMALRILEINLPNQGETQFLADTIRCAIGNRGKSMDEAGFPLGFHHRQQQGRRFGCDAAPLES